MVEKELKKDVNWKITPRFIEEISEKLYSQPWEIIFIRGTLQNSIDAKAKNIEYIFNKEENSIVCKDDGKGMTKEILLEKFLGIGETTKDLTGGKTIGGFGIEAVGIVAGSNKFCIQSNYLRLDYCDGKFNPLRKVDDKVDGTILKVHRKKEINESLFIKYLHSNQTSVNIVYNGEEVKKYPKRGKKVEKEWGTIYYNKQHGILTDLMKGNDVSYRRHLICRYQGLTMFIEKRSYRGILLIEIKSNEVLSSTRENFSPEYKEKLNRVIDKITVETVSYGREYDEYEEGETNDILWKRKVGEQIRTNFYSTKVVKLIRLWEQIVRKVMEIDNKKTNGFRFGFIFEGRVRAEIDEVNKIIYLNPRKVYISHKSTLFKLIRKASHEVSHLTHSWHDESFSSKNGSLLDKCFEELRGFKKIVKEVNREFSNDNHNDEDDGNYDDFE